MKPDIVIAHPVHLDYPLYRKFLHDNRKRFSKVIIVFTQMNARGDYRPWLKEVMGKDDLILIDNDKVTASDDWRNVAVNKALKYTDARWIWFTEQDFFPKEGFWEWLEHDLSENDVLGIDVDGRLHPACLFVRREVINFTSKNFGVVKDKLDHFGLFQQELEKIGAKIEHILKDTYVHMAGLSQNLYLLREGQEPNYDIFNFRKYIKNCLDSKMEMHEDFRKLFEKYLEK